jgi:hypothetical protein
MKFVVNGLTFNTMSAAKVAVAPPRTEDDPRGDIVYQEELYRTAEGNFFLCRHAMQWLGRDDADEWDEAERLNPIEAVEWLANVGAALIDDTGLPLPREA